MKVSILCSCLLQCSCLILRSVHRRLFLFHDVALRHAEKEKHDIHWFTAGGLPPPTRLHRSETTQNPSCQRLGANLRRGPVSTLPCSQQVLEAHSSKYVQGNQNEKNKVTTSSHKDKSKDNNSINTDNQRVTRGGRGVIKNSRGDVPMSISQQRHTPADHQQQHKEHDDDETHNQKQHDPSGSIKKEECESSSNRQQQKGKRGGQVFEIRCHTKK